MITLPNILTIFRIIGIVIFLVLFFFEKLLWSIIVLFFSALTDILDGLLARILKQESELGSFLDPLADKLLVGVTTIMLATRNLIPWWLFLIIFIREILIIIGWFFAKYKTPLSLKTKPKFLGKVAVFFQMVTLILVILTLKILNPMLISIKFILFIITGTFCIVSLVDYLFSYKKIYLEDVKQ
jgi:cardiolipin synthase